MMRFTSTKRSCLAAWFLAVAVAPGVLAQDIYRHVDANGRVTFSDRPQDGGKKISLSPTNRSAAMTISEDGTSQSVQQPAVSDEYRGIRITQPAHDLLVRDNAGNLGVMVEVSPALREGDRIRLLVDGTSTGAESSSGQIQLANVDRGSHQLQAQVVDKNNKVVLTSEAITVHMMRHSKQFGQQKPPAR